MDKASASGAGDSRFESWAGHFESVQAFLHGRPYMVGGHGHHGSHVQVLHGCHIILMCGLGLMSYLNMVAWILVHGSCSMDPAP